MKDIIKNKKSQLRTVGYKPLCIKNDNGTIKVRNTFVKDNDVIIFKKNVTVSNNQEKNKLVLKPEVFNYIKGKNIRLYIESQSNMLSKNTTVSTFVVKNLRDTNSVKSYRKNKINEKKYSFWGLKVETINSITELRSIRSFNNSIHFVEDKLVS